MPTANLDSAEEVEVPPFHNSPSTLESTEISTPPSPGTWFGGYYPGSGRRLTRSPDIYSGPSYPHSPTFPLELSEDDDGSNGEEEEPEFITLEALENVFTPYGLPPRADQPLPSPASDDDHETYRNIHTDATAQQPWEFQAGPEPSEFPFPRMPTPENEVQPGQEQKLSYGSLKIVSTAADESFINSLPPLRRCPHIATPGPLTLEDATDVFDLKVLPGPYDSFALLGSAEAFENTSTMALPPVSLAQSEHSNLKSDSVRMTCFGLLRFFLRSLRKPFSKTAATNANGG